MNENKEWLAGANGSMFDGELIPYISAKEFRERGYLCEINRLFLHPLGMALEIAVDDDGSERFVGIWDYRNDPEGIYFTDGVDPAKAQRVESERAEKASTRREALGYEVQPVGFTEDHKPLPRITLR
jgi:hypothetical protein